MHMQKYRSGALHKVMSLGLSEKGVKFKICVFFLFCLIVDNSRGQIQFCWRRQKKIIDGLASLEMPWGFTDWIPCQWGGATCFSAGWRPHGAERPSLTDIFFWKSKKRERKSIVFCLNGLDGWCPLAGRCSEAAWWLVVVVVHVTAPPPSPPGDRRPPQS